MVVATNPVEVVVIHLLPAAVRDPGGASGRMLQDVGVGPGELRREVDPEP